MRRRPRPPTAERTFHSSVKTREEVKDAAKKNGEMDDSKTAKLNCSNGIKNKPSTSHQKSSMKSPEKSPKKSSETVKNAATDLRKTDVATDLQSSQSMKSTEPKRNTRENVQNSSNVATSKNMKSSGSAQKSVSTTEKAAEKASVPEKTGEKVRSKKKSFSARRKAKNIKAAAAAAAAAAANDNNADPSIVNGTNLRKSAEMSALEDAPEDSRKPQVISDTRHSQFVKETESKREAKKNNDSITISEELNSCAQESVSSVKMTDGESSLPRETDVASNSRNSQSTRGNDVQADSVAVFQSEKSKTLSHEPVPSSKTADDKSNLPEKTREQVKAEREAKKAAKATAKAKAKNKKTEEVTSHVKDEPTNEPPSARQISTKSATMEHIVADAQSSQKTDIAAISSQDPQIAKKTEEGSMHSATQQPPSVQAASIESSIISRQSSAISDGKPEDKSKAELRAERRAKQEAQRAAKQQQQQVPTKQQQQIPTQKQQPPLSKSNASNREAALAKPRTAQTVTEAADAKKVAKRDNDHEVNLFKHLYNEREHSLACVPKTSDIHPAIIRLGAQYSGRIIVGSNARCLALLTAVKKVIQDFVKPEQTDFTRSLEVCLRSIVAFLHNSRPVAVSMQNAIRHLKWHMTSFPVTISTDEAKTKLTNIIDTYKKEQIQLAGKAISDTIKTKISNGNIILIYGFSSLICNILMEAHTADKQFRVIVVDGRPWLEGREQLRRLVKYGINCSYIFINAVSFIMPEVSKVFLGAHAILANGAVMSRVGTSQIALIAKAFNVPVLVACETHKTCGRVQTDSIVYNELGDADDLVNSHIYSNSRKSLLTNWRARKSLNLLNIIYDVTPADLITAVVTELAILPCSSVPVILRFKPSEF